ncbi:hypothetical protein CONLIGDRAFT_678282 [Coniochaeta ligniaria NRRL 30616]|uniref:Uncharacterized protein n=1 Tax=Coniochaeta ligniaria NRRL 30616 TaxID=1408157 RepID=A0A1J7JES7_9PEZI|nr:hypothetical protein CONLIGDRAFT_678282 [Coniochaeta ligniaria NRRL 30616]
MNIHGQILQVQGMTFDTIKEIYQMEQRASTFEIIFTNQATGRAGTLEDLLSYLTGPDIPHTYSEPQALALARTLCIERIEEDDRLNFADAWNAFRNWNRPGLMSKVIRTPKNRALVEKFWRLMTLGCQGRALVLTKKGRYGLASCCSSPGDVCCVFDGGLVPFLLRPSQTYAIDIQTKGDHRLVGEAYIHGAMQGEAVEMLERGEAVERVFGIF